VENTFRPTDRQNAHWKREDRTTNHFLRRSLNEHSQYRWPPASNQPRHIPCILTFQYFKNSFYRIKHLPPPSSKRSVA